MGQLQSRIDHHTEMLAHIDAGKRLGALETDVATLDRDIKAMDGLLHNLSSQEETRYRSIMKRLGEIGWQPYLKEE